MNIDSLRTKIRNSREKALTFIDMLKVDDGYKYTVNHDFKNEPSALQYGTWSAALTKKLILGESWDNIEEKEFIKKSLLNDRQKDGTFFPNTLLDVKPSKSFEYLKLHCSNYSLGALLEIDKEFDFQSSFLDKYLDPDFLNRWLNQRSFNRPWEESNNIVNVASYLQLVSEDGNNIGKERLYQMLEWHNRYQNPKTAGFDNFNKANYKNILESMAGAVHNFHIHLYLNEPLNYESKIAKNVIQYLMEGPLTACLSIDFVELSVRTLDYTSDKEATITALLLHLESLLEYQNDDGGWYENETSSNPTVAAGMSESIASSCSYATWFRLCSIGMISIALLGDDPKNWSFKKMIGMGYSPEYWPNKINIEDVKINRSIQRLYKRKNIPKVIKKGLIKFGVKVLG